MEAKVGDSEFTVTVGLRSPGEKRQRGQRDRHYLSVLETGSSGMRDLHERVKGLREQIVRSLGIDNAPGVNGGDRCLRWIFYLGREWNSIERIILSAKGLDTGLMILEMPE